MADGVESRAGRALWLVAEHGVLSARQVGVLLEVSRPTAHRLLRGLAADGLLERPKPEHGSEHRRLYRVSWSGGRVVTVAQRRAGLAVFSSLFARPGSPERQHQVNEAARAHYAHALAIVQQLSSVDPTNVQCRQDAAYYQARLAELAASPEPEAGVDTRADEPHRRSWWERITRSR